MSFSAWLQQLDFGYLIELLVTAAAALLCITFHESAHGLSALWLGDDTAKRQGRISLNPLRHVDPVGLVMMVIFHFGWAKPVGVNMYRFKNPKVGMAVTAATGPASNVILAFIALLAWYPCVFASVFRGGAVWEYLAMFFQYVVIISAGLAVFNLIPIPPLDGSKMLFSLLPQRAYAVLMRYERYGFLILVALLMLNVLDTPLAFLRTGLLNGLQWLLRPYADWVQSLFW